LGEFRAEHNEAGNEHRIRHNSGCNSGWRHMKAFHHAPERDGQRSDIERHDHLAERDGNHRNP
jgi:hypothetical protein